ncbi:MAG: glycosyltransferase family 9 protein [Acidobacteriota bacterium]|nr:glycosyltransferase family 9 protein [Acidobacteriota bacterium]
MRILICRTDALGDVVISLPVQARILERCPEAEIHWLVRPYAAPLLQPLPGIAGVQFREPDTNLVSLIQKLKPDAVLNLSHRDRPILSAAKAAGVPIRVARARGLRQMLAATHLVWGSRRKTGRHEADNALDFLAPFGWSGGKPTPPRLNLDEAEQARSQQELAGIPRPRLGVITRGSGSGAFPSPPWWARTLTVLADSGWNPVVVSPPEDSSLEPTDLRGLMTRMAACDAILGPSTGPTHIAAALGIPVVCMMGLRSNHAPSRWAPLGEQVEVIQYPGPEADLRGGMDRLEPEALLRCLEKFRVPPGIHVPSAEVKP